MLFELSNTNPHHKSQTHGRSVRVERKITNPWHNLQTRAGTTHRILESFDDFVSGTDEEGFRMVMGGKERAVKRWREVRVERREMRSFF